MRTRRQWIEGCSAAALCAAVLRGSGHPVTVRMGLSASTLNDANLDDARAAIRVWGEAFRQQAGISLMFDRSTLFETAGMLAAIRAGGLDAFAATTNEYRQVASFVDQHFVILDEAQVRGGYEYLVLAHRDRKVRKLADLNGRGLLAFKSPATSLAEDWLETALAESGLGPGERFFNDLSWNPKLSKVVLPVYFQQADACLTTADSFATLCELNPQLASKLVVVMRSPRLVASLLGFHKSIDPAVREAFLRAAVTLHQTVPGKQVLTLFQTRQLYRADASVMQNSLNLAAAAARLRAAGRRRG